MSCLCLGVSWLAKQFEVTGIVAMNVLLRVEAESEDEAVERFRTVVARKQYPVGVERLVETSINVEFLFEEEQ